MVRLAGWKRKISLQTGESLINFHGLGGVSMAEVKSRLEGKRIFIVNDEPDILKTLGELFSMAMSQGVLTLKEQEPCLKKSILI